MFYLIKELKLLLIPILAMVIVFSVVVYTESMALENKTPDIIFQGFVKDKQRQSDDNELITFGIRYMEKGTRIDEISVLSMNDKEECSINFEFETPYMVYAVFSDDQYVTNSCLGTSVYILRDGSKVVDDTTYQSPFETP